MKEKILDQLKQEFSNLGLTDELLNEEADTLATSGIVTDDNLATIVKGQENRLKKYQSSFDKLRTENAKYRKQLEELADKGDENQLEGDKGENELITWLKSFKAEQELKAAADAKRTEVEGRNAKILAKAKELEISKERIEEGFAIADDADDTAINDYLAKVRKNEIAKGLDSKGSAFTIPTPNDKGKELAKAWANNLPEM